MVQVLLFELLNFKKSADLFTKHPIEPFANTVTENWAIRRNRSKVKKKGEEGKRQKRLLG
jgi:hypothetical protein